MNNATRLVGVMVGALLLASGVLARDWPQWRGANRDARAVGFKAPATWPKGLTQKWKVTVGDGVATPALVGDKLYVFAREGGDEVVRCLEAATGKEVWQHKEAQGFQGRADGGFPGPRSSPTVAEGKVVTLGVNGLLCCLDAASGKVAWRKDDFPGAMPMFHTSSSPIVIDGLCIAQLGGDRNGGIVAYDLATGTEKWKWIGDGPAYASPVQGTVGSTKLILTTTKGKLVAVGVKDGKLLWEVAHAQGRYNAASPIVEGNTVYSGASRGTKAVKLEQQADRLAASDLWSNADHSLSFNTPVVKDGLVFAVSVNYELFCIKPDGKTAWTGAPLVAPAAGGGGGRGRGGQTGYGSIVDAGPVLFALTPHGQLVVFEPTDKEFKRLASYKVAEGNTYAYPIISGNRLFIKDKEAVTLWTIE